MKEVKIGEVVYKIKEPEDLARVNALIQQYFQKATREYTNDEEEDKLETHLQSLKQRIFKIVEPCPESKHHPHLIVAIATYIVGLMKAEELQEEAKFFRKDEDGKSDRTVESNPP